MKKYNIWYCHPYACAPTTGKKKPNRSYYLSKEWSQLGHQVTVITSSFEHIGGMKSNQKEALKVESVDGVNFAWLKTPRYLKNGIIRIINMLAYAYRIKSNERKLLEQCGTPDVIICSVQHPFHFKACLKIAKKTNALMITEIRDLWPLSLVQILNMSPYHPLCLWLSFIEKQICKKSDLVVSVLNKADQYLSKRGLSPDKFICIPNGYTPKLEKDISSKLLNDKDYQKIVDAKRNKRFIIGYTGAHGKPNHLEILCEAMKELEDKEIELFLIGNGTYKEELLKKYSVVSHIHFLNSKPKDEIFFYQKQFDLGYAALPHLEIWNYGISPNKRYEYMYNEVPTLVGYLPEDTPIHKARSGIFFDNDSKNSLVEAILRAKDMSKKELAEMGNRGKNEIVKNYLYSYLAKKYIDLIT